MVGCIFINKGFFEFGLPDIVVFKLDSVAGGAFGIEFNQIIGDKLDLLFGSFLGIFPLFTSDFV
ncbi:MAG: hypothetical protein WC327_03040 [Candidatus Cloacimonadia bacterium]